MNNIAVFLEEDEALEFANQTKSYLVYGEFDLFWSNSVKSFVSFPAGYIIQPTNEDDDDNLEVKINGKLTKTNYKIVGYICPENLCIYSDDL